MGKHKKHKKQRSHPFTADYEAAVGSGAVAMGDSASGSSASPMKVVWKFSSPKHQPPVMADPVPLATELLVKIPLALLRPVTPTALEEEEERPLLLGEESGSQSHKHKKHKKHKKHSSHETYPLGGASQPVGGGPHEGNYSVPSSSLNPFSQPTPSPRSVTTPPSGKQLSFSQVESSPFKFTISKSVSEESPLHLSRTVSPSALPGTDGEKKGHKHKKRHHHHHHHSHSPLVYSAHSANVAKSTSYDQGYSSRGTIGTTPPSGLVGGARIGGGKPHAMFSSPEETWAAESEELSPDEEELDPGVQSRVQGLQSHNQGVQSDVHDGRSHDLLTSSHKKKKDKKRKHKHSHVPSTHQAPHFPSLVVTPPPMVVSSPSAEGGEMGRETLKRRRVSAVEDDLAPPPSKKLQIEPLPTKAAHQKLSNDLPPASRETPPPVSTQVKLSSNALRFFLKNLYHLIRKRDPEGIFLEPVTDDIAPGYSSIIKYPMDLTTIANKIENTIYHSVQEFKSDFILMCNNAMTYNAPETVYYATAKRLLSSGLQIIAKETSLRPDIKLGHVPSRSSSVSPLPIPVSGTEFVLPPPSRVTLDYSSPFLCRLPLAALQDRVIRGLEQVEFSSKLGGSVEVSDQSHLTQVVVGCDEDLQDAISPEEILDQVQEEAAAVKENLDMNYSTINCCFLNQNTEGKTMLNFLNPESGEVDSCKPVDLTALSDHIRMGSNAATVLRTELPMMKATPVSYLMYGPFGSFAPVYDSAFATLSKMDSDLLLSTYGSELGVSYAHSLQQFVRGASGFVSEMANAVLNGLTNSRHSLFKEKLRAFEEKSEQAAQEANGGGKDSKSEVKEDGSVVGRSSEEKGGEDVADGALTGGADSATTGAPGSGTVDNKTSGAVSRDGSHSRSVSVEGLMSQDASMEGSKSRSVSVEAPMSGGVSLGDSKSRSVSVEALEFGVEGSKSRSVSVEPLVSRGDSIERSKSRSVSVEATASRGISVEDLVAKDSNIQGSDSGSSSILGMRDLPEVAGLDLDRSERSSRNTSTERSGVEVEVDPISTLTANEGRNSEMLVSPVDSEASIEAGLMRASSLLSELQATQTERLSLPPYVSTEGHSVLHPPSRQEIGVASEVRQELSALTGMVGPADVVSVSSLHKAMGVSLESLVQSTDPSPAPEAGEK